MSHGPTESSLKATPLSTEHARFLDQGIHLFNSGKYGPAHEEWEKIWKESKDPEKTHLKAFIQVCGLFHLIQEKRFDPALRLAMRSLELFAEAEAHFQLHKRRPILDIPGVEDAVLRVAANLKCLVKDDVWFLELGRGLQAKRSVR